MGASRETRTQQRRYLLDLATRFQDVTTKASEAHYEDADATDTQTSLRLATAVVDRNELFNRDLWQFGHTMAFEAGPESGGGKADSEKASEETQDMKEMASTRYQPTPNDLDDILSNEQIYFAPDTDIMEWLEKVYRQARGFEMGTFHSSLMPSMWKKQSCKWEQLALGYISDIVSITHIYISDLLKEICGDDRVRGGLMSVLMEPLVERYKRAIRQTEFLFDVERTPLTNNHYFADNLEKW